jgi:hypothetical protein
MVHSTGETWPFIYSVFGSLEFPGKLRQFPGALSTFNTLCPFTYYSKDNTTYGMHLIGWLRVFLKSICQPHPQLCPTLGAGSLPPFIEEGGPGGMVIP